MQFVYIIFVLAQIVTIMALAPRDSGVVTAERVYHTMITQSPYMVDETSTTTWTQSPSITDSQATVAPTSSATA
ncbi:hypothetical protein CVT25_009738 [Psilocybe cyanescens]|uniref:Uncharacterized protein n=1 Tax=Psilocybe cyanescens TaxID=93625 RepID=A0A409XTB6_PSICY|nr:hypothetical protein CVT25_009738 [Psilocybe cyanescens]